MANYQVDGTAPYFAKRNDGTFRKIDNLPENFVFVSGGGVDVYWLILGGEYGGKFVKKTACTLLDNTEPPPVDPPPVDPPPDSGYTLIGSTVTYSVDGITYVQHMKPDSQP